MPFLTLNGITVPVDPDGGAVEWVDQADAGRGVDGSFLVSVTTSKRKWKIGMRRLAARAAAAWARLVKGYGHRFSFADLYSSKGLLGVTTGTVTPDGASGKFSGGKRLTLASTATAAWTLGTDRHHGLTADYTISVWHEDAGVWNHYLIRAKLGAVQPLKWWLNGADQGVAVLGAGSLTWLAVDTTLGKVTLSAPGGVAHAFSEMVVHPFAIGADSGEWVTSFSGATIAHPDLPSLRAGGTMVEENGLTTIDVEVDPVSVTQKPAPFMSAGVWEAGAKEVDFDLEEL